MLRPATPLSALLLVAFIMLLLSVISVPVTRFVPMGKFKDVTFGVFGFCKDDSQCSPIGIGYDTGKLLDNDNQAFELPVSVRDTISAILVVHPVAAFLTLAMLIMAVASHFHIPAHSARYLLILVIFTFITFLVCLLAFLVDVLLFIPHMAWGSYMVLGATIMLGLSGVSSCIMRRTMVSRKARRKRIDENAEMSGENYYNREGNSKPSLTIATAQPTVPLVSGGIPETVGNLPQFARFENPRKDDQVSDERVPLTQQRSPAERSPSALPNNLANAALRSPSRDPYGNPAQGPPDAYANRGGRGGPGGGYGRGGSDNYGPPMRGRGGGYASPSRGGQRGGRAAYGPPPRGGYGMRGGRGPPPSYNNHAPGYFDRRPSADALHPGQQQLPESSLNPTWMSGNASMPNLKNGYDPYNPDTDLPRAESPPPLPGAQPARGMDDAIEMDATPAGHPSSFAPYGQVRDGDLDVVGMVGLQQSRPPARHDTVMSDGSRYSTDEVYVPPRAAWNQNSGRNSPVAASPGNPQHRPGADRPPQAGNYYEDIDAQYSASARPLNNGPLATEPVYEDVHATVGGARSPAESERSNLTSISQRGVNPRWNPPNHPPMPHHQGVSPRRLVQKQQQRQDMLLDNPDFQLPGGRSKVAHRGGPGMTPGSAYPNRPL